MQKTVTYAVIQAKKETFDRLETARVFACQSEGCALFLIASLEASPQDQKDRAGFLETVERHLAQMSKRPVSEREAETQFEEAISGLNERLNDWLINHPTAVDLARSGMIIGSLVGTTLVLTGFGQIASVYLHGEGDAFEYHDLLRDIRRDATPQQEKIFRSVMMGRIEIGDRVLFGNTASLRIIPKQELTDILTNLPSASAAETIAQRAEEAIESVMAIVMKSQEKSAIATHSAKHSVEDLVLAEARTEDVLMRTPRSAKEVARKLGRWSVDAMKDGAALIVGSLKKRKPVAAPEERVAEEETTEAAWEETIAEMADEKAEHPTESLSEPMPDTAPEAIDFEVPSDITPEEEPQAEPEEATLQVSEEAIDQESVTTSEAELEEESETETTDIEAIEAAPEAQTETEEDTSYANQTPEKAPLITRERIAKLLKPTLALIILIGIGYAGSAYLKKKKSEKLAAADANRTALIADIRSLQHDAEAKLIYHDDAGAKLALDAAAEKLAANKDVLSRDDSYAELAAAVEKARKTMRKEFSLDIRPGWSLPAPGMRIGARGKTIAAMTEDGTLVSAKGSPIQTGITPTLVWFGDDTAYSMDANGTLSSIKSDGETKTMQGILPSKLVDATMYSGRLYAVNPSASAILRMDPTTGGFGKPRTWNKADVKALGDARGITIDSDVYIATKNDVLKFSRGTHMNFALDTLDPAPSDITRISTSETSTMLYLLEPSAHRLIVVSKKTGTCLKQYLFEGLADVKDVYVDEAANTVYLVSGMQVVKADL